MWGQELWSDWLCDPESVPPPLLLSVLPEVRQLGFNLCRWHTEERAEGRRPNKAKSDSTGTWLGLPLIASEARQEVFVMGKFGPASDSTLVLNAHSSLGLGVEGPCSTG